MKILIAGLVHSAACSRQVAVAWTCLLLCLLIPLVRAANLAELQLSEAEGIYRIRLVMQMQVPAQYVRHVLTDYTHIYRLDPAIVDSGILPAPDAGVVRVMTRIHDCIAFFCMNIDRVEDVRELEDGGLQATTVPDLSNFRSGYAEWNIMALGEGTQVSYQAQMEPDFFIPPVIGSYFVKRKLRQQMLASLERVECIARIQAGLERNPGSGPVLAGEVRDDHTAGAALLAGQDPTRVARAPAAGSPLREDNTGCVRPCRSQDVSCRP